MNLGECEVRGREGGDHLSVEDLIQFKSLNVCTVVVGRVCVCFCVWMLRGYMHF